MIYSLKVLSLGMKIYKNKYSGSKITEDTYNSMMSYDKMDYYYLGSTNGNSSTDSLLLSGIIGYATNSGIVGGLLGGSLIGGILGDALKDEDDSIFF